MKIGMQMYKWGMMVWLKGENYMKQLQEMCIHIWNPTRETITWSDFTPKAELLGRNHIYEYTYTYIKTLIRNLLSTYASEDKSSDIIVT